MFSVYINSAMNKQLNQQSHAVVVFIFHVFTCLQMNSSDATVKNSTYDASGCFKVLAKTTAVFVEPRKG